MGLRSWLTGTQQAIAPAAAEERGYSVGDPSLALMLGYATPGTPIVGEYSALTLSAVWRAVQLISGTVASLPMRGLVEAVDGTKTPVASLMDNPGGELLTPFEWRERVVAHLLLHGNAYLQHLRNGAGQLIALHPVHPGGVQTSWAPERPGGKLFRVGDSDLDATSMTQIMGLTLDGLTGLSPIGVARLSLGTGLAGDKAAHRLFANGALVAGLVTPSGDDDLTVAEAKVVKDSINRNMLGAEHAGDIAVVNRALTFTPWSLSAADAQFLQSRTFSIEEIGRWYGVPPHLLGLTEKSTSWGQGIAEQNRGLHRYTLTPWTGRIEARISQVLPTDISAEFDYSAFLRPSPEDEVGLLIEQVNNGLLSPNEARRARNLPPIPDGDTFRQSVQSQPVTLPTPAPEIP